MPLQHSKSDAAFHDNVAAEIDAGKPRDQALAIAYSIKRKGRATGGMSPTPWQVRSEARSMTHSGPILSAVPGRTDHHPMAVAPGSYVVNADTVSHLGQNNTNAGLAMLGHMFGHQGPYGVGSNPAIKHGSGAPRAPRASVLSKGGRAADHGEPVDIMAAGGEFVIPPEIVRNVGGGDIAHGHKILDEWMKRQRKDHIRTLQKLPGPAKS